MDSSDVVATSCTADIPRFAFREWLNPDAVTPIFVNPLVVQAHPDLVVLDDGVLLCGPVLEVLVLGTIEVSSWIGIVPSARRREWATKNLPVGVERRE